MKINYWSDYACPYCYIGETRLKHAIDEMGIANQVEIESLAFELDPNAPFEVQTRTDERFARKYQLSLDDARAQIEHISQLGRDEGLDFRYASTLYTNTRDAHRLAKLAHDEGGWQLADRISEKLFDAYFTRNEKLANRDVLLRIATEVGMDGTKVGAILDSDRYTDEVRYDEREAAIRGIHGVPYFVINGDVAIPGAVSVRAMKNALERALKKSAANSEEHPHQCGPEGCAL